MSDDLWDDDLFDEDDDAALNDREKVKRRADRRRNKAAERAFEETRNRRESDLHLEQRIRHIVGEELGALILLLAAVGLVWGAAYKYGAAAGVAAFLAVIVI